MARRSSLLVSLALASLFLGLAAALSATSFSSEVEPLTGSAATVTSSSSSAVAAAASVTSSADFEQTEPATVVVRNVEEQPSEGVAAGTVEPADAEDGYPAWDEVTEGASTDKGLAGETAPGLQGSTAAQEETRALPETSSAEVDAPIPVIRLGCGGIVTVRMFEPNMFGGLMLRGRGSIVFVRAFPWMALTHEETPGFDPSSTEPWMTNAATSSSSDSVPEGGMDPRPLPFAEGVGPEGVVRSMESLFSLAHPLSLFRDSLEERDQWHAARMRALAALHGDILHRMLDSTLGEVPTASATSLTSAAGTGGGVAGFGAAAEGLPMEEPQGVRMAMSVGEPVLDASSLWGLGPMEWNPTAVCGLVLLGLSFSLLLSLLLMGLASLVYGAPEDEEEDEKAAARREASVQTPLLKVEEEPDEKAATVNPVCKYEPPAEK